MKVLQKPATEHFSLNSSIINHIFKHARPLGHNEKPHQLNLGFGFLYYGLVRAVRPRHVLVIGSGFGFSVICLALALKDNKKGELTFIDPSYSVITDGPFKTMGGTGQWNNTEKINKRFQQFGVEAIVTHYKYRSDEFFPLYEDLPIPKKIDVAFIDGSHAYNDVKYDFLNALQYAHKNTYIFLHDTNIYIREAIGHAGVEKFRQEINEHRDVFEVLNFPYSSGVSIIRIVKDRPWKYFS